MFSFQVHKGGVNLSVVFIFILDIYFLLSLIDDGASTMLGITQFFRHIVK